MNIQVIMDYDRLDKVNVRDLQQLINDGKVIAFRRTTGWVKVGGEPIRGGGGEYGGPERREYRQKHSSPPPNGITICSLTPDDWSG
jgi:hypothetical protein